MPPPWPPTWPPCLLGTQPSSGSEASTSRAAKKRAWHWHVRCTVGARWCCWMTRCRRWILVWGPPSSTGPSGTRSVSSIRRCLEMGRIAAKFMLMCFLGVHIARHGGNGTPCPHDHVSTAQGMLQGTTRLLVTHQRQYLPLCDRIVVLREGAIVAQGPYAELAAAELPEVVLTGDDVGGTLPSDGVAGPWEIASAAARGDVHSHHDAVMERAGGDRNLAAATRREESRVVRQEGATKDGTTDVVARTQVGATHGPVSEDASQGGARHEKVVKEVPSTPFERDGSEQGPLEEAGVSERAGTALRKSISRYFQVGGQAREAQVRRRVLQHALC